MHLHFLPRPDVGDVASAIRDALANPIDFPTVQKACVPGDKVLIALDPETPRADAIIAILWKELSKSGVLPEDVTILQAAARSGLEVNDPRVLLAPDPRSKIEWVRHDPQSEEDIAYLASSTGGQRIYLASRIVHSDFVIAVGVAGFDPLMGFRGESGVLYPALSNSEAIEQAVGQGHDELTPQDQRPLRQLADEVGWLLGMQFVVSVIPGHGDAIQAVFAGASDAVARTARKELFETCVVELDQRVEMVLIAIESGPAGQDWDQVAEAVNSARRIVDREGRIVVLTQLDQKLTEAIEVMRQARTPEEAVQVLESNRPKGYQTAIQLAKVADWANVYLRSELPSHVVEELFMIPLESDEEVQKLIQSDDSIAVIESAQKVFTICQ
ncbi:hypothetical protein KOR42_11820 [Thalassoglobus neptunius]|uniref:HIT domain-containing protein n=1 Tax=Thalassoglobus neptunius TaxID=1938619 RepID=A0A5C5X6P5_9PLAN|nr:lactate racemase domain-containing protein [Thalassoglobus neptunius]TWT57815.1 hypothetical protein KOR42_11820 [Thalassoglobus neptunius]